MSAQVPRPRTSDSPPQDVHLDAELRELRAKAERITGELSELYRRIGELRQQISGHQQRVGHGRS